MKESTDAREQMKKNIEELKEATIIDEEDCKTITEAQNEEDEETVVRMSNPLPQEESEGT